MERDTPEPNVDPGETTPPVGGDMRAAFVPRWRTLSGFAVETPSHDGIGIESLAPGTTLNMRTRNSRYRLTVLDGVRHHILIQGAELVPTATPADLQGATAGGSLVRTGWIEVDRRMELNCGSRRIITSPVQSVSIETSPAELPLVQHHA